jgi:Dyp-type peroxidase family
VRFDAAAVPRVKAWLASFAAEIATADMVDAFNTTFRTMRAALGRDPSELRVLWRNVAFSAPGLAKLTSDAEVAAFVDGAFKAGAEARSSTIGDPANGAPGDPRTWVAGTRSPDMVLILAADDEASLDAECASLTAALQPLASAPVYVEHGHTRAAEPGHEHFGFRDGISQPGVRGRSGPNEFFTPRLLDPSDPLARTFAAPGQPLVWPGEFLLNLPQQLTDGSPPTASVTRVCGPAWATNGSYLVFRRLRQDVPAFNAMVARAAAALRAHPEFATITDELAGALIVGRFKSGVPVMRALADDPELAKDVYASNNFLFEHDTPAVKPRSGSGLAVDTFPPAHADGTGARCPFAAHVRKVNPRDETTDFGGAANTLARRLIRRGIPYGPDYDAGDPASAAADRGLLFLAYCSSIQRQFEDFVLDWVNADAPHDDSGPDPVVGLASARTMTWRDARGVPVERTPMGPSPVVATGGAYLFAPAKSAILNRLARP